MLQLYNGNALNILKNIAPGSFGAVITDPPYSTDVGKTTADKYTSTKRSCPYPDFAGDNMDQLCWIGFMTDILTLALHIQSHGSMRDFYLMAADSRAV